jgi:pimeloyl-ACP methyl ester carboxylesterase
MSSSRVNDIEIAYSEYGQGEPLLLIHGGMISGAEFQPQIAPFSARYRLIVPDVRGHGMSGRGGYPYSIRQWANDMAALLHALGIGQAFILGHSMGGMVAQQLAADHPQKVRALVIAESNYGVANDPMMRFAAGVLTAIFKLVGAKTAARLASAAIAANAEIKAVMTREIDDHAQNAPNLFAILDAMNDYDGRPILPRIACPTLVLCGADNKLSHKQGREMAQIIPNARLEFIANAGHGANWDNAADFNHVVLDFLAAHGS